MKPNHSSSTLWIVVAIVAAILFSLALPTVAGWLGANEDNVADTVGFLLVPLELGGKIFLSLLKMVVVPLVMASVMSGVLGMGDVRKLGWPGLCTLGYFIATTLLAVLLGLVLVNIIQPGNRLDQNSREQLEANIRASEAAAKDATAQQVKDPRKPETAGDILKNLVLMLFTDNLLKSAVEGNLLPLIAFSVFFAGILTTMWTRVTTLIDVIRQTNEALMALITVIMRIAPVGIFCLVAERFGRANAEGKFLAELAQTGYYSLTILLGLAIFGGLVLPAILVATTRRNPLKFIASISEPLLMAFSTASSSATLPVTIETMVDKAKVSRKSVDFVVPLGATVNMNGTALYEAVAAIFIAQALGVELGPGQMLVVALTATLAAIGAAGIPEAGLVTMPIVLASVGLPAEGMALILTVDWLLDRFRTAINVMGDAMGAAVVERAFPEERLIAAESESLFGT